MASMTTGQVAKEYGLHRTAVYGAIRDGRLASQTIELTDGRSLHLIDPDDAEAVFGYRRYPLAPTV